MGRMLVSEGKEKLRIGAIFLGAFGASLALILVYGVEAILFECDRWHVPHVVGSPRASVPITPVHNCRNGGANDYDVGSATPCNAKNNGLDNSLGRNGASGLSCSRLNDRSPSPPPAYSSNV